jgi:hypothetical protein
MKGIVLKIFARKSNDLEPYRWLLLDAMLDGLLDVFRPSNYRALRGNADQGRLTSAILLTAAQRRTWSEGRVGP